MVNTYIICYRNLKSQKYIRVAQVRLLTTKLTFEQELEEIFSIMNGQQPRVRAEVKYFYNPQSLRSMSVGDIIEVDDDCSMTCMGSGFEQDSYDAQCRYELRYSVAEQLLMGIDYDQIAERRASRG